MTCTDSCERVGRLLVLLVVAEQDAGLDEVLAEDGRVVVLQDEQVLVVQPGRLVPEDAAAVGAQRAPVAPWLSRAALLLDVGREERRDARRELVDQLRVRPPRVTSILLAE